VSTLRHASVSRRSLAAIAVGAVLFTSAITLDAWRRPKHEERLSVASTATNAASAAMLVAPPRLDNGDSSDNVAAQLAVWARKDPALALETVETWALRDDEKIRYQAVILSRWARVSPRSAWAWVKQHVGRGTAAGETPPVTALLQAIAIREPNVALTFVTDADWAAPEDRRQAAYAAIIALVTTGHVDLAAATLRQWSGQPEAAIDERTLLTTTLALASAHSPQQAAEWLDRLPPTLSLTNVAPILAATWAETNPSAALAWANSLSAPGQRSAALRSAYGVWSDHDVDGAMAWFLAHESLPNVDQVIPMLIQKSRMGFTDPMAAAAWAALPSDTALRYASFEQLLRQWSERDAPAASRFLANTNALSASERVRLSAALGFAKDPAQ
jgi:hypothetical protein